MVIKSVPDSAIHQLRWVREGYSEGNDYHKKSIFQHVTEQG